MNLPAEPNSQDVCVRVDPGNCGFSCRIRARREDAHTLSLKIEGSECEHIKRLSQLLKAISIEELFAPPSSNPVFRSAEQSGCHPSCPLPVAVLKAAEVAMELALPQTVVIRFES